jgi:hypothetical protein
METAMLTDFLPVVYAVYASVSVVLTIWLARTLGQNGRFFLLDVFPDNTAMADAVNQLLVVGFYLVNFGYACLLLRGGAASTVTGAVETLAGKLGYLLLSLAVMHFANLYVFHRIRRRSRAHAMPAPLAPHGQVQFQTA